MCLSQVGHCLTRGTNTNNNANDFDLACPTPTNFAGATGSFGACSPPTTTTTTTSSTTTSTVAPAPLTGKVFKLSVKLGDDSKKKMTALSKDPAIAIGANGGPDDPVLHGATLRVVSDSAAGAFDTTYSLPAGPNWTYMGKAGQNKGYKWKDKLGTITGVQLKPGKSLKITGKGAGLGHDLDDDPNPVTVVFTIGGREQCMSFGGTTRFKADKSYAAKDAPAPGSCP